MFDYSRLAESQFLSTSTASIYANPVDVNSFIRGIYLCNTDLSNAIRVTLYRVPDSGGSVGTASASHTFYNEEIPAGASIFLTLSNPGIILQDTNDTIQAKAGSSNAITISIDGATE